MWTREHFGSSEMARVEEEMTLGNPKKWLRLGGGTFLMDEDVLRHAQRVKESLGIERQI
jgi:hypothetical protein